MLDDLKENIATKQAEEETANNVEGITELSLPLQQGRAQIPRRQMYWLRMQLIIPTMVLMTSTTTI